MGLPTLKLLAKTPCQVQIVNGTDENGSPLVVSEVNVNCRVEQSNAVTFTKEGREVPLKGKVFIFEEFASFPDDITGFCTIGEIQYDIVNGSKKRNPDGSINHVALELI